MYFNQYLTYDLKFPLQVKNLLSLKEWISHFLAGFELPGTKSSFESKKRVIFMFGGGEGGGFRTWAMKCITVEEWDFFLILSLKSFD